MKIKYIDCLQEAWSYCVDGTVNKLKITEITNTSTHGRQYFYLLLENGNKLEIGTNATVSTYYEKES